jgi:enoyl-CoA hydratase
VIVRNAPLAVQASKEIVRLGLDMDEQAGWVMQDRLGLPALQTEDAREGARAFAEKRPPVWKGC